MGLLIKLLHEFCRLLAILHRISRRIYPDANLCDKRMCFLSSLQLQLTVWAGRVTIDIVPDDVLLCAFHFIQPDVDRLRDLSWWQPVVNVCRRWRSVVFASPKFLGLRLVCDPWIPARLTVICPPFPIIIWNLHNVTDRVMPEEYGLDVAIVHPNRVCEIHLHFASSELQRFATAMQKPFPALIKLTLETFPDFTPAPAPALPDGFLGGSAPRLQSLELNRIPFPALPTLLSSATDLVSLTLLNVPDSGYISPEVIVAHLATSANLKSLNIQFESLHDWASWRPPLPTRTVFPALIRFQFYGVSDYLEDLVSRIDAPLLNSIDITFCHQLISDIPNLAQFMRRTTKIEALNEAHVDFDRYTVVVQSLQSLTSDKKFGLVISCVDDDWQFSSLGEVLMPLFPSIFMVEHLYIHGTAYTLSREDVEDLRLPEIFNSFSTEFFHALTTVKNLYIHMRHAEFFALILLKHFLEIATDVLPALESLCLEGLQPSEPLQEGIGQFVAVRQLAGHPVAISYQKWEKWNRSQNVLHETANDCLQPHPSRSYQTYSPQMSYLAPPTSSV